MADKEKTKRPFIMKPDGFASFVWNLPAGKKQPVS